MTRGGYALVLIGSFHPIDYILDHAAARLIFHVLPTLALVIAALVRGMHDGFGPREHRGASPVR